LGLRQLPRICLAAISMVAAAVAPVAAEAPVPAGPGLTIRVGQADDFSRVEFRWAAGTRMSVQRQGQTLTVSFNRDAKPDMSTLQVVPLKWLKSAKAVHVGGGLVFVLTLADDADAITGQADGADFVNIFQKKPDATPPADAAPPPTRPDPVPAGGVLVMRAALAGQQLRFDFPWLNPCGAAVFQRGDAIWIVFDTAARFDLSQAPKNVAQYASMQAFSGQGWSAVRIVTRTPEAFVAQADGSDWAVTLQPFNRPAFSPVRLARDDSDGPATLTAAVAGASGVYWIDDPAVGDKIGVVTALGPAKGLPARRDFFQLSLLPSAQGLAVEPHVDDLAVAYSGDIVTLSRPKGLALSPAGAGSKLAAAAEDAPTPAALPGLIGADWDRTPQGFVVRYDALMGPVSDEEAKGVEGPTLGHMALARFLIGEQLSFEAIGLLNDALHSHPALGGEAEFRALRGMARVMAGRYKEAETDFASPALEDDPAASLWRGYVFAKLSQWPDARKEFAEGTSALSQFPPLWRARFARAAAETALSLGDLAGAKSWITYALSVPVDPIEDAQTRLLQARLIEQQGDPTAALAEYQVLEQAPTDAIAGPAILRATQIQLDRGLVTPAQAATVFDGLRFRWRGGSFELETIRALGQLYLSQGRYREALEALRSAGQHLPDLPEAVQLQADLNAAFKSLFLDGQADGLQPIQALALFFDFKELTPVGEDGDAMVRKLTRRLVDVDLLPQAEDLLKYQVDNRLDGVPKAQVATDLAVIYLMDRKPEDALDVINASRTTVLPNALNLQRRIVAARALTALGQYDAALEMLGSDATPDGVDARAEVVWKQKAWPQAGALFEKLLGDRYKTAGPLSADQEGKLLRAAVAYSLAGDDISLGRLRTQYAGFIDGARNPEALRVALSGMNDGRVSLADFSRMAADNQIFEGWVDKMKERFRQAAPPSPRPAVTAQQVTAGLGGAGAG
jgi:tetratricopeptide (TPR) repeat protein